MNATMTHHNWWVPMYVMQQMFDLVHGLRPGKAVITLTPSHQPIRTNKPLLFTSFQAESEHVAK